MSFFSNISERKEEMACYALMLVFTGIQCVTAVVPFQIYIAGFSMACIVAGAYRSLD
jgi:hypothetical protein